MRRTIGVFLVLMAGRAWAAPAGALDLELDQHGSTYVLHDAAYSITFPGKPVVQKLAFKFEGEDNPAVSVTSGDGNRGYNLVLKPMAKHWLGSKTLTFDSDRDGFIRAVQAKVTSETATTVAGLEGRHVSAVSTSGGQAVYSELDLLWDTEHRVLVALITTDVVPKRTAAAQAFVASLTVQRDARGPLDPDPLEDNVATKSGTLDFEVVRHGSSYTVRDAIAQVTFPDRPSFRTYMTSPMTIVGALANRDEVEGLTLGVAVVPDGATYDPVKGRDGTRDGMLAQWKNNQHKETKLKVGKLDGTRIVVTGTLFGVPARGEIRIVWDARHRRMFTLVASTSASKLPASTTAFLDSLAIAK